MKSSNSSNRSKDRPKPTDLKFKTLLAIFGRWLSNKRLTAVRPLAFAAYFSKQSGVPVEKLPRPNKEERDLLRHCLWYLAESDELEASEKSRSGRKNSAKCAAVRQGIRIRHIVASHLKMGTDSAREKGYMEKDVAEGLTKEFAAKYTHIALPFIEQVARIRPEPNPFRPLERALKLLRESPLDSAIAAADALEIHLAELKKSGGLPPPALDQSAA